LTVTADRISDADLEAATAALQGDFHKGTAGRVTQLEEDIAAAPCPAAPLPAFGISTERWAWLPPWHQALMAVWARLPDAARRTLSRRFPAVYLVSAIPPSADQPECTVPDSVIWGAYSRSGHRIVLAWPLAEVLRRAHQELLPALIGYVVARAYLQLAGWGERNSRVGTADDVAAAWGFRVQALRQFIARIPHQALRPFIVPAARRKPPARKPRAPDPHRPAAARPQPTHPSQQPGGQPPPPPRTPMPSTGPPPPTDGGSGRRQPKVT
jgi:hypothetical protein